MQGFEILKLDHWLQIYDQKGPDCTLIRAKIC
jgi:hypothetical protein